MCPRSPAAVIVSLLVAAVTLAVPGRAEAAVAGDWAGWGTVDGAATAFGTSVTLPGLGGPVAEVTSTASTATVVSGASTWFGPASPPGGAFGSSRDRAYLNQSPRANVEGSPAVTTYTFSEPPAVGWGLVLGDIDADQATVSAVGLDGEPLTVAQLGFQSAFNLCATTPRPSGVCGGTPLPTDVPTWLPGTATLQGNAAKANTSGASGWFRPTVPVRSLRVAFGWREGFPIYQTWLAGLTRTVSGALTGAGCDVAGATVTLLDGATELAQVQTDADGAWSVSGVAARDGLTARLDAVPQGCRLVEGQAASLPVAGAAEDDADLDFAVEPVPTVEVTSVLEDGDGRPVPDAELALVGPEGDPVELPAVVSDAGGRVTLPAVPPGTYEATLTPPAGYTVSPATTTVVVPPGGGELDLGFVLERVEASPSASPTPSPTPSPAPAATSSPAPPAAGGTSSGTGVLPATGGPSGGLLPGGGLLLAAGAALLVLGRRQGARR